MPPLNSLLDFCVRFFITIRAHLPVKFSLFRALTSLVWFIGYAMGFPGLQLKELRRVFAKKVSLPFFGESIFRPCGAIKICLLFTVIIFKPTSTKPKAGKLG